MVMSKEGIEVWAGVTLLDSRATPRETVFSGIDDGGARGGDGDNGAITVGVEGDIVGEMGSHS